MLLLSCVFSELCTSTIRIPLQNLYKDYRFIDTLLWLYVVWYLFFLILVNFLYPFVCQMCKTTLFLLKFLYCMLSDYDSLLQCYVSYVMLIQSMVSCFILTKTVVLCIGCRYHLETANLPVKLFYEQNWFYICFSSLL